MTKLITWAESGHTTKQLGIYLIEEACPNQLFEACWNLILDKISP
jgi:hypothetical protein